MQVRVVRVRRRRNRFCSDVGRLRGQKARRTDLLNWLLPEDPARAERHLVFSADLAYEDASGATIGTRGN